jgi:hypothetical protein
MFSSMTLKFIAELHLEDSSTSHIFCGEKGVVSQHSYSLNRKIYYKLHNIFIGNFDIERSCKVVISPLVCFTKSGVVCYASTICD